MKLRRRGFLGALGAGAMGLVLPYEPKRIYSFPTRLVQGDRFHQPFIDALIEPYRLIFPVHMWSSAQRDGCIFGQPLAKLGIDEVT